MRRAWQFGCSRDDVIVYNWERPDVDGLTDRGWRLDLHVHVWLPIISRGLLLLGVDVPHPREIRANRGDANSSERSQTCEDDGEDVQR